MAGQSKSIRRRKPKFPLWKLPALARFEVIRSMEPVDLIELSMISSAFKKFLMAYKLVCNELTFKFLTIESSRFRSSRFPADVTDNLCFALELEFEGFYPIYAVFEWPRSNFEFRTRRVNGVSMKVANFNDDLVYGDENMDYSTKEKYMEDMTRHLLDIFHVKKFSLDHTPNEDYQIFDLFFWKIVKKFELVCIRGMGDLQFTEEYARFLFGSVQVNQLQCNFYSELKMMPDDVVLKPKSVDLEYLCDFLTIDHVINAECEVISVHLKKTNPKKIVELVKKWQSGEKLKNLKKCTLWARTNKSKAEKLFDKMDGVQELTEKEKKELDEKKDYARGLVRKVSFESVQYELTPDLCSPLDPTTFFFAYSNDLDPSVVTGAVNYLLQKDSPISTHYFQHAVVRFDTKTLERFSYFQNWGQFINSTVQSRLPDPTQSFNSNSTGSDVLTVLNKFLDNSQVPACGSRALILVKRYPNATDISGIVAKLRLNHVSVTFIVSENPSGGSNSEILYNIASQTNGFCVFEKDSLMVDGLFVAPTAFNPYLIYAVNPVVSKIGTMSLPPLSVQTNHYAQYFFTITIADSGYTNPVQQAMLEWISVQDGGDQMGFGQDFNKGAFFGNAISVTDGLFHTSYNMTYDYIYSDAVSRRVQIRIHAKDPAGISKTWPAFDN